MQKIYISLLATFLLLLSGCASVTSDIVVDAETDPKANLSGYKTFTWVGAGEVLNDPHNKWKPTDIQVAGEIKYLIDRELRKRGLELASLENADLGVAFFVGVDMEAQKLKKNPETKVEMIENIPEAGLIIALIDTQTGYVVWVGEAVGELQENATKEVVKDRIDYAVTEMIKLLPKK